MRTLCVAAHRLGSTWRERYTKCWGSLKKLVLFVDDNLIGTRSDHIARCKQMFRAIIEIETLHVLGGRLSPRVMGLVVEWALLHRDELLEDWRLARESAPLKRIAPLE